MESTKSSRHNPGRRLELGHLELGVAVGALLERELMLNGGHAHLTVGQQGMSGDDNQQCTHDQGHREEGGHQALGPPQAPTRLPPTRDGPQRGSARRAAAPMLTPPPRARYNPPNRRA